MWFYEFIGQCLEAWQRYPVAYLTAGLVGGLGGCVLSRLRHQGRIDALSERVKHKDDVITFKDKTIEELSAKGPEVLATDAASAVESQTLNAAAKCATNDMGSRFLTVNSRIIREEEERMRKAIDGRAYDFVFNPQTNKSKLTTFNPDGSIGEGRNDNEHRWRISSGRLEILNATGQVYSRFILLRDGKSLHHTNEPDTKSIRGQYMEMLDPF